MGWVGVEGREGAGYVISRVYGEVGAVSSKWALLPVGVRTGWCHTIPLLSPPSGWDTLICPMAVCFWESFWKVTQDKMAILPFAWSWICGQGATCGWSQPLVGLGNGRDEGREGLLGAGLKYGNEALGVRWRRVVSGRTFQRGCKGNLSCC